MSLYLPNKRERSQRRKLLVATLLVLFIFAFDFFSAGTVRGALRIVGSAVWSVIHGATTGITTSGIFATRSMVAHENARLKGEISALEEMLAHYQADAMENETLREMAILAEKEPGLTASVVSSFKASPYGTFLIGAGEAEGVRVNVVVLSKEGFVIGKVIEVSTHQALVEEVFAPRSKLEAIAGSIPLTLAGSGGGNAMGEAPRGSQIATGTPVRAPELDGRLVGIVGDTEGDVAAPSVKVYVRTPVNIETLQFVYVTTE
ncbi:rod shape-determining protein MreC [Candidatus Parcubacteria bacterium]|nr:MAG: rod shape-determining protein MreC [Candidatus Parcubacteria bacterium]